MTGSITSVATLHHAIAVLEARRREQEGEIRDHCVLIAERATPMNIVKSIFRGIVGSPDVRYDLLNAAVAIASGFISRRLLLRPSMGVGKKIIGGLVHLGAASLLGISLFRKARVQ